MKKNSKRIKWYDWLTAAAIVAIILVNPLIGDFLVDGLVVFLEMVLSLGSEIQMIAVAAIAVALVARLVDARRADTPKAKKNNKVKSSQYIDI